MRDLFDPNCKVSHINDGVLVLLGEGLLTGFDPGDEEHCEDHNGEISNDNDDSQISFSDRLTCQWVFDVVKDAIGDDYEDWFFFRIFF